MDIQTGCVGINLIAQSQGKRNRTYSRKQAISHRVHQPAKRICLPP